MISIYFVWALARGGKSHSPGLMFYVTQMETCEAQIPGSRSVSSLRSEIEFGPLLCDGANLEMLFHCVSSS